MKTLRTLVVAVFGVACACQGPSVPEPVDRGASPVPDDSPKNGIAGSDGTHSFLTGNGRLLDVVLDPDLDVRAIWDSGGRVIRVNTSERDLSGAWVTSSQSWSTSFDITDLASAGSHLLFVAGVTDQGDDVVEAWQLDRQTGSRFADSSASPAVLFEPPFQLPVNRPPRRSPERTVVFEGDLPGIPVHLVASADGSRVYGLFGEPEPTGMVPNTLYSISVATGSAAATFSSDTDTFLQLGFMGMGLMSHPAQGHALFLQGVRSTGEVGITVLYDSDSDGELEAGAFFNFNQGQAAGLTKPDWNEISG